MNIFQNQFILMGIIIIAPHKFTQLNTAPHLKTHLSESFLALNISHRDYNHYKGKSAK